MVVVNVDAYAASHEVRNRYDRRVVNEDETLTVCCVDRPTSAQEWDGAVSSSRDAWLYCLSDISQVDFWSQWKAPLFVECRQGGHLIGGALLSHGTTKWNTIPLGPLGRKSARTFVGNLLAGPFVVDGLSKSVTERARQLLIEELVRQARALGCEDLWLGDPPQSQATITRTTPVNAYVLSDEWENCQRYHFFVDLRAEESARFDGLKQERRTAIRRARKNGTTVVAGSELSAAEGSFVRLMSELDPVRALTPEKLRAIWAALYEDGRHGQAFFALEEGRPRALACVTVFDKVASYHLGARTEAASNGAHALALWEGMCWAADQGYEWFDVGRFVPHVEGTEQDAKERAISRFKEGFGGRLIAVDLAVRHDLRPVRSPTLDFVWAIGRSAERRFGGRTRQRMPPPRF